MHSVIIMGNAEDYIVSATATSLSRDLRKYVLRIL